MSGGAAAHGHTGKHSGTRKHEKTKKHHPVKQHRATHHEKHHVHAKGTHVKHAKARGYALAPWLLPVCSLEAVAMSLRLAGQPVHDDEVAWLWELCGGRELSIGEALQAAARFGLNGCFPCEFAALVPPDDVIPGRREGHEALRAVRVGLDVDNRVQVGPLAHALILGVDRPGPHAVLATPRGWWSWGELYSPWPCAVEEGWAVSWS